MDWIRTNAASTTMKGSYSGCGIIVVPFIKGTAITPLIGGILLPPSIERDDIRAPLGALIVLLSIEGCGDIIPAIIGIAGNI